MKDPYRPRKYSLAWWWSLINSAPIVLVCVLAFADMFGYQYIPTLEWVSLSSGVATAVGAEAAVFAGWLVFKNFPRVGSPVKGIFLLVFWSWLSFILGKSLVILGVPAIVAAIAGADVETQYVVKDPSGGSDKHCRIPIALDAAKGTFASRICSFSQDFRAELYPGSIIAVSGRGTFAGLFVESIRKVQ